MLGIPGSCSLGGPVARRFQGFGFGVQKGLAWEGRVEGAGCGSASVGDSSSYDWMRVGVGMSVLADRVEE